MSEEFPNGPSPAVEPAVAATVGAAAQSAMNVLRLLRSAGAAVLAQASLHSRLVGVEWAQEKQRLARMLVALLLGVACLLCLMLLGGAVVLVAFWDTPYRAFALIGLLLAYSLGGLLAWARVRTLARQSHLAFAATRDELAADIALIRSRL